VSTSIVLGEPNLVDNLPGAVVHPDHLSKRQYMDPFQVHCICQGLENNWLETKK
jgi:hypothetical protein